MFKIKLDHKTISNIINIYFVLFLWVCLIGMMFQSSNEFIFVTFLLFSLFYFAIQISKVFLNFKLISIQEKKMPKKAKKVLEKKFGTIYMIVKKITDYFTIFIFALATIYIVLYIENISPTILLLMMIISIIWIIYLIIYNVKAVK